MIKRLIRWLITRSWVEPDHLVHADGSRYMERYWLFTTRWGSARLHRIVTADYDRHLHDHPWTFLSIVLSGFYIEERPVARAPSFSGELEHELTRATVRRAGSIARRFATDRHRISLVFDDVWTIVLLGPPRQWWGFYTKVGKIYWRDYASCLTQALHAGDDPH